MLKPRIRRVHETSKAWQLGGLAVLLIAAIALWGVALNKPIPTSAVSRATPVATPTPSETTEQISPTVADSMALLEDVDREWSLSVLGDSTGNGDHEWVYLVAESLSSEYDRQVTIHDWDDRMNEYGSEHTVGDGPNAAITIWNSSASGQSPDYQLRYLAAAYPEPADLVIVNHGHNASSEFVMTTSIARLIFEVNNAFVARPAVAVTLQNPRTDDTAEIQESVVAALREQYSEGDYSLIDVYSAFDKNDLGSTLGDDGRHPTEAGEKVWASAVETALGLR